MDVQVVSPAAAGQQQAPDPPSPPVQSSSAAPVSAAAASSGPPPGAPSAEDAGALSSVVARVFGGGSSAPAEPISVNVSYRVEHDPNIIVTVFTDPKTGKEIAQVPAEVMVRIAQFFDKQSGVTLDRSA